MTAKTAIHAARSATTPRRREREVPSRVMFNLLEVGGVYVERSARATPFRPQATCPGDQAMRRKPLNTQELRGCFMFPRNRRRLSWTSILNRSSPQTPPPHEIPLSTDKSVEPLSAF